MRIIENNDTAACVKSLAVEIEVKELQEEIDKTYQEFSKNFDVPGFRRGHAPRKILKMRYGKHLEKQALQSAADQASEEAFKELNLRAASSPKFEEFGELQEGEPFTVRFNIEYFPQFDLAEYTDIRPTVESQHVTEKEIVERLEELRKASASFVSPSQQRGAQEGDVVTISSVGTIDGEPFAEATVENVVIELGSGRFLPGLEDGLIGLNLNEEKEIYLTIPDTYPIEDYRGKEAILKVKLSDLRERLLPEMDDEFAKDLGDFESLDHLKESIRTTLESTLDYRRRLEIREKTREELLRRNPIELPPSMIEARFNYINAIQEMDRRNAGEDPAADSALLNKNREQAEKESRLTLILDEIAKKENIEITEDEYSRFITRLAVQNESDPVWYYQHIERYRLRAYYERLALEEKVLDWVVALGAGEVESNAKKAGVSGSEETPGAITDAEMSDAETSEADSGTDGERDSQ